MAAAPRETSPTSAWKKVFVWKQKKQRRMREVESKGRRESRRRRQGEEGELYCVLKLFF